MFTLLKNASLFNSNGRTCSDLFIQGGKIAALVPSGSEISRKLNDFVDQAIELDERTVVPGLIDGHTHVLGAAGEAGPGTRAPEIPADAFISGGVTTVVGMLGLDDFTRSMAGLIARTRALRAAGISAYCLSGSYRYPPASLGPNPSWDIYFLPEVIGCGEIAISDARSSAPTPLELRRLIQESLVAASAAGKRGVVLFHMGDEQSGYNPLFEAVSGTGIDRTRIIATHLNRNRQLFGGLAEAAAAGIWCDLTAIEFDKFPDGFLPAEEALSQLARSHSGILDRVTVTSDCGTYVGGQWATSPGSLFRAFRAAARDKSVGMEKAVQVFIENPARCYGLSSKGRIAVGADADLLVLDNEVNITDVFSGGKQSLKLGQVLSLEAVERHYRG